MSPAKPYGDKLLSFVDLETSGLSVDRCEILELGLVLYDPQADQVLKEYEVKCKPQHIDTAEPQALVINGYNLNPAAYKSSLKTALNKLNKLTADTILVGQNIAFDVAFIERAMSDFGIQPKYDRRKLELMSLAWGCVHNKQLSGLGLKDLCTYFSVSNVGSHTALVDCQRALSVYKSLMDLYAKLDS